MEPSRSRWSKSPSMAISLPSRTEATMPQPHEQKLQEVVNSLMSESFNFCVLARTAATSTRPPSANPTQPPAAALNHSLLVTPVTVFADSPAEVPICTGIPFCSVLFESKACSKVIQPRFNLGYRLSVPPAEASSFSHIVEDKDHRHVNDHSVTLDAWARNGRTLT